MTQAKKKIQRVLVLRGQNIETFHRPDPENPNKPACHGHKHSDKPESWWKLWDREKAEAWKRPCGYPGCWQ
jgi:hypothetical protein